MTSSFHVFLSNCLSSLYTTCPVHLIFLDLTSLIIFGTVMKLFVQLSSASYCLLPPRFRYSPQHSILKCPKKVPDEYSTGFICYELNWTLWSWVPLGSFPAFYGTRRSITAFTRALHLYLSWARPIQTTTLNLISKRSVLMLSIHLCLGLPSGLFPSGFPTNRKI
jgi:hypothetical protein